LQGQIHAILHRIDSDYPAHDQRQAIAWAQHHKNSPRRYTTRLDLVAEFTAWRYEGAGSLATAFRRHERHV